MERAAAGPLRFLFLLVTLHPSTVAINTTVATVVTVAARQPAPGLTGAHLSQTPAYREPASPVTRYLLLLRKGPAWSPATSPGTAQLQRAHLLHLSMLAADKHLLISGAIGGDDDLRGVAILDAPTIEEARAIEADDPAVKAGRLSAEILPISVAGNWFVFAAITGEQPMRQFAVALVADPPGAGRPDNVASAPPHLEALWRDRGTGALVLAGSIGGGGPLRGLRVYVGDDLAAATAMAKREAEIQPALSVDVHAWSAADGILSIVK
jgi:uncharacterized protein YciI